MPQVSKHPLAKPIEKKVTEIFLETIVRTNTTSKATTLIRDLLTPTEQVMLAKRLAIAYLLEKGWGYRPISQTLKVSLATIARIKNIRNTAGESFKTILESMLREEMIKNWFAQLENIITAIPPKGRNWSEWAKQRYLRQKQTQQKL